jgi:cytidine deaminase
VTTVLSPDDRTRLIASATAVRERAYAVYSSYQVGAALLATDGRIYAGCNVENANYPAGICAERSAIASAVSAGARAFSAVVVVTVNGVAPCGICRQVLNEFAPDMWVVGVDTSGHIHFERNLRELLPLSFSRADLA